MRQVMRRTAGAVKLHCLFRGQLSDRAQQNTHLEPKHLRLWHEYRMSSRNNLTGVHSSFGIKRRFDLAQQRHFERAFVSLVLISAQLPQAMFGANRAAMVYDQIMNNFIDFILTSSERHGIGACWGKHIEMQVPISQMAEPGTACTWCSLAQGLLSLRDKLSNG